MARKKQLEDPRARIDGEVSRIVSGSEGLVDWDTGERLISLVSPQNRRPASPALILERRAILCGALICAQLSMKHPNEAEEDTSYYMVMLMRGCEIELARETWELARTVQSGLIFKKPLFSSEAALQKHLGALISKLCVFYMKLLSEQQPEFRQGIYAASAYVLTRSRPMSYIRTSEGAAFLQMVVDVACDWISGPNGVLSRRDFGPSSGVEPS